MAGPAGGDQNFLGLSSFNFKPRKMKVPDAGLAVMVQDREPLDTHSFEVVEKFLRPSTSLSQSESSPVWKVQRDSRKEMTGFA